MEKSGSAGEDEEESAGFARVRDALLVATGCCGSCKGGSELPHCFNEEGGR